MNVVYDISMLGAGQMNQTHRGGIFRVAERLASGLMASGECALSFSATHHLPGAVEYWNSHPVFRSAPLLYPRARTAISQSATGLSIRINRGRPAPARWNIPARAFRSLLWRSDVLFASWLEAAQVRLPPETDLFHSLFYPLPSEVRRAKGVGRFLTVYDLTPILHPRFFAVNADEILRKILASIDPETWILCISEACKADLCEYLPFELSRVFVTPLAADAELFYPCGDREMQQAVRRKYGVPEGPYLLSLCTLRPHKNIDHLIRCFGRLIRQEGLDGLNLVLVGAKAEGANQVSRAIEELGPLRERVVMTGFVADEDLAPLYSGATAFVYPSFVEGFGLPPLEAMQCGVPVITSNTSSLPEVVGDAGFMVDPTDADALCQRILALYHQPDLRAAMSARSMRRAREFSWERCTEQTLEAYRAALSAGRR